MANNSKRVIIAGAGLGGLTLALALVRQGFDVVVLEQAAQLGEVGAGVQVSANGNRVLHALGLAAPMADIAFTPEHGEMRHWQTGAVLSRRPLGTASLDRYGFPYFHLHRADFHRVLSRAVHAAAPNAIRLNQKVTGFRQTADGVTVTTASGEKVTGDLLVGADGIHSTIRAQLLGQEMPNFTGCMAWRATVPVENLPKGHVRPVASNWLGGGGHFVHYYIRRGALVNCVGVMECDTWEAESWSAEGRVEDFIQDFTGWHEDLQILMRAATHCFRWGLFDRDPFPQWSDGRVTLLGDACHPMLPFMAQGAVMAIEDGYVLSRCLAANPGAEMAALKHYESLRMERTTKVQAMSRNNIHIFHNADAPDLEDQLASHRDAHAWLYRFDATALPFSLN